MSNSMIKSISPAVLPSLPYADNALEPVISAKTIGFHYGKHHKGYVDNLNKLIADTEFAEMTLEKIITETAGKADKTAIFNNAAQAWNHAFYWRSLRPGGGGQPPAILKKMIDASFGSVDACLKDGLPRPWASSAAAGHGLYWMAANSRWSRPPMRSYH